MSETIEDIYKDTTIRKAEKLRSSVHAVQRDAEDETVWWCKGSTGSKYRVQVLQITSEEELERRVQIEQERDAHSGVAVRSSEFIRAGFEQVPLMSCTCPNGMNRGGRPQCYHTAAVLLILRDGTQDQHPVMENTDPINEDFLEGVDVDSLRAQGFTDTEIEFLRS